MKQHPFYPWLWLNELGEVFSSLIRDNQHKFGETPPWFDCGIPQRKLATTLSKRGYLYINVHKGDIKKNVSVHLLMMHTYFPDAKMVDHIDRDKTNCRLNNLRPSDGTKNGLNRDSKSNTGYLGISYEKSGQYRAGIKIKGKSFRIGSTRVESEVPALAARREKIKEHYIKTGELDLTIH